MTANQIEFINLIVDYLTKNGVMERTGCLNRRLPTSIRWGDGRGVSVGEGGSDGCRCWRRFGRVRRLEVDVFAVKQHGTRVQSQINLIHEEEGAPAAPEDTIEHLSGDMKLKVGS